MNETQTRWSIKDAAAVYVNFTQKIKTNRPEVRNHPTFGVAGGRYCTGPPGRARSPGIDDILFPDHPPNSPICSTNQETEKHPVLLGHFNQVRLLPETYFHTEYQLVISKNKIKFITNIKNLKIMKKQILILAFFVLAMIAGSMSSFGQLAPSAFPTPTVPIPLINCVGDPQHPKAGISYKYELDATGSVTAPSSYKFWATKDQNFISGLGNTVTNQVDSLKKIPGELINYSVNYRTGGLTPEVDITWTPEILSGTTYHGATPTFVVGFASDGCTDNIKVWEIEPSPSFTVDITNINEGTELPLAYGTDDTQCVDKTRAAKYNTTTFGIDYNYGADTLYYEVIAANFVTSWVPTFILTGLDGVTQNATIGWASSFADAKAGTFIESDVIAAGAVSGTVTGSTALTSTVPNTTNGVSLIVRVIIENHNVETLAQETITFAVAGQDADGFDIVDDATCTVPATAILAAADDVATRTIDPRPTIDAAGATVIILPNVGTTAP